MNRTFIKLIIPCYGVEKEIGRMLDSILNQTFQDYHIVCVEDCSPDKTWEVLQQYKEKHPDKITLIKNPENLGPGETRNQGYYQTLETLPSEFIWMVDGDDFLPDNQVLQKIYDYHLANPEIEIICLGWMCYGKKRIADITSPNGPFGICIKPEKFVPYINRNIQRCEDVYQHFVQFDSIDEDKIGQLDYVCYSWWGKGHRASTKENSRKVVMDALKNYHFKHQYVVEELRNFRGDHIVWYQ